MRTTIAVRSGSRASAMRPCCGLTAAPRTTSPRWWTMRSPRSRTTIRGRDHLPNTEGPPGAGTCPRCGAARVRPPWAPRRSGRPEALEASRRRPRGRPPRAKVSRRRPCAPTSRSSIFRATTCSSILPGSGGCRSTRSPPLPDEELCARVDAPARFAADPAPGSPDAARRRGDIAAQLAQRPAAVELDERGRLTAERFTELREQIPGDLDADAARTLLRELKAVGGDLPGTCASSSPV